MTLSTISALSPLDGRYASRVAALRPLMSEFGLMQRRVQVEVEWFIALGDAGFAEFKPLAEADAGWVTMHGPKIEHKRRQGELNAAMACGGGTEQLAEDQAPA